jgi:hypothetical protein
MADFCAVLTQFSSNVLSQLDQSSEHYKTLAAYVSGQQQSFQDTPENVTNNVIRPVIKRLHIHSRDILFKNGCMFVAPILMFNDTIDISDLWRKQNAEGKKVIWEFVEQLYVIGYIVVYPEKKTKFLELVRALKQQNADVQEIENQPIDTPQAPQPQRADQPQREVNSDMDKAVSELNQMLGLPEGGAMADVMGEVAVGVDELVRREGNPQLLLQKLMRGDPELLGGMVQNIGQSIEQKIQSGQLNREDLQNQAQSMAGNFQSLASQIGMNNPMLQNMMGSGMFQNMMANPDMMQNVQAMMGGMGLGQGQPPVGQQPIGQPIVPHQPGQPQKHGKGKKKKKSKQ